MARDCRSALRRVGDFIVPSRDLQSAEESFGELSERRQDLDRAFREPIPAEKETWREAKARFDYPGVDTPTEHPGQAFHDRAELGDDIETGEIGVVPEEKGLLEGFDDADAETGAQFSNLKDAIFGRG